MGALGRYTKVSSKIVDSESWKTELMYLAQEAEQDGRTENAIAYYRMSEFLCMMVTLIKYQSTKSNYSILQLLL